MKLNKKEYLEIKTREYFKKNRLFFFLNGVNINSDDWIKIEQSLNIMKFNFFKNFNKITNKKLKNSTFKNMKKIINGPTFFIKPTIKTSLTKNILLSKFCSLLFTLLAIKINNKIYPITVLKKNTNLINYTVNALLFYQFSIANSKYYKKLIKKTCHSK